MKVYLAGPINGCNDEECKDWREYCKQNLADHYHSSLDPMIRDYRGVEDAEYREIVDLDKRDIRNSDILIVNYPKPSVGTAMEVFFAWTLGIPIIVVARPDVRISPWLRYHSTTIVPDFGQAIEKVMLYA